MGMRRSACGLCSTRWNGPARTRRFAGTWRRVCPSRGFGHPLYQTDGDPRAAALLHAFDPPGRFDDMIAEVGAATGQNPTIDVALAALAAHFGLPEDAP